MLDISKINAIAKEISDYITRQMGCKEPTIRQILLGGAIQGNKSWTAVAVIADTYKKFQNNVSFSYCTIESVKEEENIEYKLKMYGVSKNKIIILKSDGSQRLSVGQHLANIEKGCVYIWILNYQRMNGKNWTNYKVALTKFTESSKSRYHIAFTDDLHTSVKDKKDLKGVPDNAVLQYNYSLPIRDILLADFRRMDRVFVVDISGTNASQLGRPDGKYKLFKSWCPEHYTKNVKHIPTSVSKRHWIRPGKVREISRTGNYPSLFDCEAGKEMLTELWNKGQDKSCFLAKVGKHTLDLYEAALGTVRDLAQKKINIGVCVTAGTEYDKDKRILKEPNDARRHPYWEITWENEDFVIAPLLFANHHELCDYMTEKYSHYIIFDWGHLSKCAKSICGSNGDNPLTAMYASSLPKAGDALLQMVGRLFGTYNIHPVRYLACSDGDFESFEMHELDNEKILQFLEDNESADAKTWEKEKKNLVLSTRDHTNAARQFPREVYHKSEYVDKLSEEEQKKQYPELVLVTGYIQIEEYDYDDLSSEKITIKTVNAILEEDDNWTTPEQEQARNNLRKITNKKWETGLDSVRNISKEDYVIRFLHANPVKMAEETWTRIMFAWTDKCTIIYHKFSKDDIEDFPIFGVHDLDGKILVFNTKGAYIFKDKVWKSENEKVAA